MRRILYFATLLIIFTSAFANHIIFPSDAYPTIQTGIDAIDKGDTVIVKPGVYNESLEISNPMPGGKATNSQLSNNYKTIGSYYLLTNNESYIDSTCIEIENETGIFAYGKICIKGLTIRNCSVGIESVESPLVLENLVIENNSRGIKSTYFTLNLKNVIIRNNVTGCAFNFGPTVTLNNTTIVNNVNSIIGGDSSKLTFINCTVANNEHGIYISEIMNKIVSINSIFWNKSNYEFSWFNQFDMLIAYSCIKNGINGVLEGLNNFHWLDGNIESNPEFVDVDNGNFSITKNSPCYDSGIDCFEYNGYSFLNMQSDEFLGNAPDIGSFEVQDISAIENGLEISKNFKLLQNYPNPFNGSTIIKYELKQNTLCNISIYNIKDELVETLQNQNQPAGEYSVQWKPINLPSGVYICKVHTGFNMLTKKIAYLK